MYLQKIYLNLRCREVRRDIADPYEMHSTLSRAFSLPDTKLPPNSFLWRLEPEKDLSGIVKVLVQSNKIPVWDRISVKEWFGEPPEPPINLKEKLDNYLKNGNRFRYRLKANPSVCKNHKRLGLLNPEAQSKWLFQKGENSGFKPLSVHLSRDQMLSGNVRNGKPIRVFSVLYDGILELTNTQEFEKTLANGIGHGKAMGLGLLSIIPILVPPKPSAAG